MRLKRHMRRVGLALPCAALALAWACAGLTGGPQRAAAQTMTLGLAAQTTPDMRQLTVTLHAADCASLHQLACRIAYNPRALRFNTASRSELVDSRAVFFSTAKGEGYVPVAFTYHPGEAIPAASGAVATLTFDVLDPAADTGIVLIDDEQFLIARDGARRSLHVRLGVQK